MTEPKVKKPRNKKEPVSETETVRKYANGIIHRQITRGHAHKSMQSLGPSKTTNKDLALDTDFFFSIVFQSARQKEQFLKAFCEKFSIGIDAVKERVQIMNGMKLAAALQIPVTKEQMDKPPYGSLDLRPYVLDNETF